MLNFVLVAATITGAILILLIRPLFRSKGEETYARHEQNIYFARQRLNELEQQLADKTLSNQEYDELKFEIENNLALDLKQQGQVRTNSEETKRDANKSLVLGLCCSLPVMAIVFYWLIGTPTALNTSQTQQQATPENIVAIVQQIESRLEAQPDDLAAWKAIAPVYRSLNLYDKAKTALSRIIELGGADASTYAELADTLALGASGIVTPQARKYVAQALELDANNQVALWLAGLSSMQSNDTKQAVIYWQRLSALMDEFPEQQLELQAIIDEAQTDLQSTSTLAANTTSDQPAAEPQADKPIDPQQGISITVNIDPSLNALVDSEDTVFVVALARNGPPAPLAVKRLKVADLPTQLTLSDNDAMLPQFRLSLFDEVDVSARISKSGQAIPRPGDLSSDKVGHTKQNTTTIELLINQQIGESN